MIVMSETDKVIKLEDTYGAHNYHPLPVVISKAEGCKVWDPEGREYLDFLAAYSAVNQGHCHPKIIQALINQSSQLTICSRAFYSDKLGPFEKLVSDTFGYEMVLPMNSGAEAVETALKLARKWGYQKKGIPKDEAIVLACTGNFHGRTIAIIGMSSDPDCTEGFGPFLNSIRSSCPSAGNPIRYNFIDDLKAALEAHGPKVAGFLVEPVQGEAGVIIPDEGYLKSCYDLCKQHNVLFMADEIQSGLGRTGKMLAVDWEGIRPDVVILGKALSGGVFPVSAVLADRDIMLCIKAGQHGSTYGGNPLGCSVGMAAVKVLIEEDLCNKSIKMGEIFRNKLKELNHPVLKVVRGRGLMNAIEIDEAKTGGKSAWDLCCILKDNGLITKPTHNTIIRLTPPLCITEQELIKAVQIINQSLDEIMQVQLPRTNMDQFEIRKWFEQWGQCMELTDDSIPKSLYEELAEPFRKGDPVFSGQIARELVTIPYSDQLSRILAIPKHSKKRVLICEIYSTSANVQYMIVDYLDNELIAEDLSAIEIALLAAFQQDLNIEASMPQVRIPNLSQESIYHLPSSNMPNRFPFKNCKEVIIKPDPSMYPSRPVTKIDDYSRSIVLYRLCRFFQDNLPSLPYSTKIAYCVLIERLATVGTRLVNKDVDECLKGLALKFPYCPSEDNSSMVSLLSDEIRELELNEAPKTLTTDQTTVQIENIDFEWLAKLFDHSELKGKFTSSLPLYLLWSEALVALDFSFPNLSKMTRKQLLRRSKHDIIPQAILALS